MTVPTFLTLIRLILSLTLLPFLILFLLPLNEYAAGKFLAVTFALVGLTDFLDGYLARTCGQESLLGRLLDPLADKCFVIGALMPLVALHKIYFYWAFLIIARELIVTGLRHIAAQYGFSVAVSRLGKLKATFQYCYIIFMVGAPWPTLGSSSGNVEQALLIAMLFFSLVSGALYCREFFKQWRNKAV